MQDTGSKSAMCKACIWCTMPKLNNIEQVCQDVRGILKCTSSSANTIVHRCFSRMHACTSRSV